MNKTDVENQLTAKFPKKHVSAALEHFSGIVSKCQNSDWEPCIAKSSKFIEAVLKAISVHVGHTPPTGRQFKADKVLNQLGQLADGAFDDALRLTIPRASRFVYDIASNRGARHDPDEVDPNEMDANVVVPVCSWILAELVRYAQKGALDISQAQELVESLSVRRYPMIEEIDGRVYFHHHNKSALDVALMTLAYSYPKRLDQSDLIAAIRRHGFKMSNARVAVQRVKKFVDDDGQGNMKVLAPGRKRAEEIMSQNGK